MNPIITIMGHRVELIYILYYTNVIPFEKMASLHLHHRQHHIHISCYIRSAHNDDMIVINDDYAT